jgi:general secretion pathway protein C
MQETAVDIEAITRLHLFGRPQDGADAPDKQPVVVIEAEETRLDLLLLGVVVSDVDAAGRAIISHRNRQDLFAIGDKLPGASQVRLQQILPGRVIIDNDGRYESLWLYEQPDTSAGLGATPQLSSAMQGATQLPVAASAAAGTSGASLTPATATPPDLPVQALEQDAPIESLADIIQFTPVHAGGRILGYRIAPGRAPQLFEKLGLKKNDVITGINGNSLDDPTRALKIYRQIQASKAANFELMRDGQTHIVEVMLEGNHA